MPRWAALAHNGYDNNVSRITDNVLRRFAALAHNGYDNNVSRITDNVLRRFASSEPL